MKLDKKGFTLMELLGVIIILSLLLLIVLPSIINSIKSSEDDIDEVTEKLVFDATNLYISDNTNYSNITNGSEFCISLTNLVNLEYLKSPIKYNNLDDISKIKSVKVIYNNGYDYELIDSNKCPEPIYVAKQTPTTGIVPTIDSNGNFLPGSEFSIKVNNKIGYLTFFVLSNDNNYVNLIAEQNITIDGNFTSELQDNDEWYKLLQDNRYGPQTAYTYLNTATSNWTNIPVIESFNYLDEGNQSNSLYGYQSIITKLNDEGNYVTTIKPFSSDYGSSVTYENIRARLPKYSEVTASEVGCTTTAYGSCPIWMVNYLYSHSASEKYYTSTMGKVNSTSTNYGYWLLSSYYDSNYYTRHVNCHGEVNYSRTNNTDYGIRPVITVPKTELLRSIQ